MPGAPIDTLVIFGAGGDLTSRLLLPGLGSFLSSRRAQKLQLIGVDRDAVTDARWRSRVAKAFSGTASPAGTAVAESARWLQADATNRDDLQRVLDAASGRVALYFALPPAITEKLCEQLARMDLPAGIVLALEKPFGTDLASAQALNRLLQRFLPEEQIFRVDHFLGKSTVLDLIGLRFANIIFEPVFSNTNVEKVEIVIEEALGLEGRAGYYDKAGALVDMIQSHLLQILALTAMEPPSSVSSEDLRGAMAAVLRATRPWLKNGTASRRARYTKGKVGRREFASYASEDGVDPSRGTETLAEMTVAIDTWRWAGVPFTLRSGKAIGDARQEIIVTFRDVPHLPIGFSGPSRQAQMRIGINTPGQLSLDVVTNGRGDPFDLEWSTMTAGFEPTGMTAYGEVLAELLAGDPTLSVRGDIAEDCWRIVTPVLAAWRKNAVPLDSYPAGTGGPRTWR
ncbi:glucose-6-phosphate dehydrogenase [Pseudolysinimonas sp.]|uniref:glucose-6-phosphate dehydrogenase n=1 Tax=Pseudolysinimonas sp. TaxID=2680009 RepID=UPI003F7CE27A